MVRLGWQELGLGKGCDLQADTENFSAMTILCMWYSLFDSMYVLKLYKIIYQK